jgi:hypothetical protein
MAEDRATSHSAGDKMSTPDAPVPIIRTEELIPLRAEANIGVGGAGSSLAPT